MRYTNKQIPFTYSGYDIIDDIQDVFYEVEFIDTFGSIQKDSKYTSVTVNIENGLIECFNEDSINEDGDLVVVNKQKFGFFPIDELYEEA